MPPPFSHPVTKAQVWPGKLVHGHHFSGPNPWTNSSVVVLTCDFPPEAELPVLTPLQTEHFNAWSDSSFSPWWPAQAALKLPVGADFQPPDHTLLGRWAAQWAHCALNAQRGFIHDSGARLTPQGNLQLWVGCHDPVLSRRAVELGLQALEEGLSHSINYADSFEQAPSSSVLATQLDALLVACRHRHPDYQARILMAAARAHDIPILPFHPPTRLWQFGWGHRARVMLESSSDADGSIGSWVQRNKARTKSVLHSLGVPSPHHAFVHQRSDLAVAMQQVGLPCVLKPLDGGGGKGVSVGLSTLHDLERAFEYARQYSQEPLLLEPVVPGEDHRLMVLDGRFVATIRRNRPVVTGDGQRTVAELITLLNAPRQHGLLAAAYLRPVAVDVVVRQCLSGQNLTLASIPNAGQIVLLRGNANLSTGGSCTDVSAQTHPSLSVMAVAVCAALGLRNVGLDYLTSNIAASPQESGGAFIEINTMPGLEVMVATGWSEAAVGALALGSLPGRIPSTLLVLEEAEMQRMQTPLAAWAGRFPGLGWKCGAVQGLGALILQTGTTQGADAVYPLLRHRCVTAVLLLVTPQELMQYGLPLDRFDHTWLCAPSLPAEWRQVLQRCCATPLKHTENAAASLKAAQATVIA